MKPSNLKGFQASIASRRGEGGTDPEHVAESIIAHKHRNVILITDGEVSDQSVKRCDELFEGKQKEFKISKIICYIVSSGSGEINMSVTCPFTRYCESKVFTKLRDQEMKTLVQHTPEDFKIL